MIYCTQGMLNKQLHNLCSFTLAWINIESKGLFPPYDRLQTDKHMINIYQTVWVKSKVVCPLIYDFWLPKLSVLWLTAFDYPKLSVLWFTVFYYKSCLSFDLRLFIISLWYHQTFLENFSLIRTVITKIIDDNVNKIDFDCDVWPTHLKM